MALSDAKWKYSHIVFDLAAAYKAADGKVSLDDAVLMATTPAAIIDHGNDVTDNREKKC